VIRKGTMIKPIQTASSIPILSIQAFGAMGDGIAMDTDALQNAIDAAHAAGGGVVRIPAGRYQIGTTQLRSNVTLSLDAGACLLGSQDLKDYPVGHLKPAREGEAHCLFYAEDATDIRFEGLGTIDGRGKPEAFARKAGPGGRDLRPRLIRMENCERVTFSGLTYRDPAFWGIHLIDCREVLFSAVKIRFRNNHFNNDGIDLDGCEDVLIENCDFNSGDDAICLKSSLNPCRNVVVRDCVLSSNTAALKLGASSSGGFIDISVTNCRFHDCPMGAIKLELVDGGRLENIAISRIVMEDVGSPLFIRLGNRGRIYTKRTGRGVGQRDDARNEGAPVGSVRNICISDVVAEVTIEDRAKTARATYKQLKGDDFSGVTDKERSKAGPIMITGIPGHYVEDVVLENITVSYPGGGTAEDAERDVPEDIARYPEQYFFGVLPAWGAYIRHARNVEFKNVQLTTRSRDQRNRVVLDDVEGFIAGD